MTAVPRPPFDPELRAVLDATDPEEFRTITLDRLPVARARDVDTTPSLDELRRDGAIEVTDRVIPGPPGAPELSVLILRPAGATGVVPAVYAIHGGGMIAGNNRTAVNTVQQWVIELGVVAVSVEYRLAPGHPHPAPVEDCYAGLQWTADRADELGIDPRRLAVAGRSAGGGLAAATALLARDRGGPQLRAQVLICPMLDDRVDTASSREFDGGADGPWGRSSNITGWDALLGAARGGPDVSQYAAPARARDLSGLPPTLLDVGSAEIFRDEVVDYAGGIWRCGGSAELHVWPGGFHGFDTRAPDAALSRRARATRIDWLRTEFDLDDE